MDEPIVGWWTLGEAPNYEVNDDGEVRHKPSGRIVRPWKFKPNHEPRVTLSAYGTVISRRVCDLIETGRRYQER